jgi:thiol-disulfide isomerase/thioredoxin
MNIYLKKVLLLGSILCILASNVGSVFAMQEESQPVLMQIGQQIKIEDFTLVSGKSAPFKNGKPTILWFFLSITLPKNFELSLPVLEEVGKVQGDSINIFAVGDTFSQEFVDEIANKYQYSGAFLRGNKNLNYTWCYPSILIFDKQGFLRYRITEKLTAEQLSSLLEQL